MPRKKLDEPNYRLKRRGRFWTIAWTDPATGRSRAVSTGAADLAEARVWRDQWLAGRDQPEPPPAPLVHEILDAYRDDREKHVASVETLRLSVETIKRHVGNLRPEMIARRTYWQARAKDGVADGSIRREVGVLRAAMTWAVRERWIAAAPYSAMPPKPPPRERWLSRAEVSALIAACKPAHLRLFVILAYHTAARRAAILGLTWDQVDLDGRRIDYRLPGRSETNKRRAVVPLNAVVLAELQAAKRLAGDSPYVVAYHDKPVAKINKGFAAACARAGIAGCSPHTLRHTAATHMVMAGVPLAEVARMLGDTEEMVERVYGKHSPDYLRRAADALAGEVGPRAVKGKGERA